MANSLKYLLVIVSCILAITALAAGCGDIEGELSSLTVSPASVTVGVNKSQFFSVIGKDSVGKIVSVTPTWSADSGIGTINSNGVFTAGVNEGTGKVSATNGTLTAEATVTVTTKGWISGRVIDQLSHRVQGINVLLQSTSYEGTTDINGLYAISSVPAGTYSITTDDPSLTYQPITPESVPVASGETTNLDFVLFYYIVPPDTTPPETGL